MMGSQARPTSSLAHLAILFHLPSRIWNQPKNGKCVLKAGANIVDTFGLFKYIWSGKDTQYVGIDSD